MLRVLTPPSIFVNTEECYSLERQIFRLITKNGYANVFLVFNIVVFNTSTLNQHLASLRQYKALDFSLVAGGQSAEVTFLKFNCQIT